MVQMGSGTCSPTPTPASMYQMKGTTMPDENGDSLAVMQYVGAAMDPAPIAKYSNTAQGCEGSLEVFSPDGTTVWTIKPVLNPVTNALQGLGSYDVYSDDQYPG